MYIYEASSSESCIMCERDTIYTLDLLILYSLANGSWVRRRGRKKEEVCKYNMYSSENRC